MTGPGTTSPASRSALRTDPYHERRITSRGPSSLVALRAGRKEPELRSPPANAFRDLVASARGDGETHRIAAANQLLDAVEDHLSGRGERLNRSGEGHDLLRAIPTEERIPLLRRAIHALRKAAKDDVLPTRTLDDVTRLSKQAQGLGWNFDWDDNIAYMDTKLVLFHRSNGSEREVSTQEFAVIRDKVGREGEWADYEVRPDSEENGSFRNFRDLRDPDVFGRDLRAVMGRPGWEGPSLEAFRTAMAHEATARWSTIITARGHFPNTIHAELERLKDEGLIANVLPKEHIFPVSLPGMADRLHGSVQSPSEAKIRVMEMFLDKLNEAPFGPSSRLVVPPDGTSEKQYLHLWGFSDDDHGTFAKAVKSLGDDVRAGRWPNVKITVFFTGTNHPEVPPHAVVIQPDGTPRPQRPEETREVDAILDKIAAYQKTLDVPPGRASPA